MRWRAERLNAKAMSLEEKGWLSEAEALYLKAHKADRGWSSPLFNLGLLAKTQRRWSESLQFNLQATEVDESNEGAWWNLGIAATALGDWATARRAWAGFGLSLPEGEGPIELNLGLTPVRVSPDTAPEVVWCRRIDPARALIRSVPLPESDRRYNDLLLHDGAPSGYRNLDGKQVPVFDELQLLAPSSYHTFKVNVTVHEPADVQHLIEMAQRLDAQAEDWSSSVEFYCKECSEGVPHKHHLREAAPWKPQRIIGMAAQSHDVVAQLEDEWQETTSSVVDSIEVVLPAAPS